MQTSSALLAAIFATTPIVAAPAMAQSTPVARMSGYNDAVVAIMKARLPVAARADRFEALVAAHYDMAGIAALVAGPKWAAASPDERNRAIAALTRHSAVSLARNFVSFDGERFRTDPAATTRGTSTMVKVTISGQTESAVLQYRLRSVGGEWRILDVVTDGISQLALQRAELAGTIASEGLAGMIRKLAEKDRL